MDKKGAECNCCTESYPDGDVFHAQCGHNFCLECVRTLFRVSFSDETLFPPRCCDQTFPEQPVDKFLTPELIHQHAEKKIEFNTTHRAYCCSCARFIRPDLIANGIATCGACNARTCIQCVYRAHEGECTEESDKQKVLTLAQQRGWKQCPHCEEMIELSVGCNHMT